MSREESARWGFPGYVRSPRDAFYCLHGCLVLGTGAVVILIAVVLLVKRLIELLG